MCILVILTVTDKVYVTVSSDERPVKVDVVNYLVVILVFQFCRYVIVTEEFINHRFKYDVEVADNKEILLVFVGTTVVFEECVEEFPELAEVFSEIQVTCALYFFWANSAFDHCLDFGCLDDRVGEFSEVYLEVIFLLKKVEYGVEEDNQLFIGVDLLLLVYRLTIRQGNQFMFRR